MKTLLISLFVFLSTQAQECSTQKAEVQHRTSDYFHTIIEFKYKKHDYIWFLRNPNNDGARGGIVHNPDCYYCNLPD